MMRFGLGDAYSTIEIFLKNRVEGYILLLYETQAWCRSEAQTCMNLIDKRKYPTTFVKSPCTLHISGGLIVRFDSFRETDGIDRFRGIEWRGVFAHYRSKITERQLIELEAMVR